MRRIGLFLSAAAAMAFLFFLFPTAARAAVTEGTCGAGVAWRFDTDSGRLSVTGTGEMDDYQLYHHQGNAAPDRRDPNKIPPWEAFLDRIRIVSVGEGVTRIGNCAFCDAVSLTEVSFGGDLAVIGSHAFQDCAVLSGLALPDALTVVEEQAFQGCAALQSLSIPDSVRRLDYYAFHNCTGLASVSFGEGILEFGDGCFEGCAGLVELTLPRSAAAVGTAAFGHCTGLRKVTVESDEPFFGNLAFWKCAALEEISFSGRSVQLRDDAFSGCSGLRKLVLEGMREFRETAFSGMESLQEVVIGEGMELLGARVFCDCTSLEKVSLPDSLGSIGSRAFFNTALWNGFSHFRQDGSLLAGRHLLAFRSRQSEQRFTVAAGFHVASGAFEASSGVVDLVVEKGALVDEGAFRSCNALRSVVWQDADALKNDVCRDDPHLLAAVLPAGLRVIPVGAFHSCTALRAVVIPATVDAVGMSAFQDCDSLETVYFTGSREEWDAIRIYTKFGTNDALLRAEVVFNAPLEMPELSEVGVFPRWAPYAGILALIPAALACALWVRRLGR